MNECVLSLWFDSLFVFVADNFTLWQTIPQEHVGVAIIQHFKTSGIKNNFDGIIIPPQKISLENLTTILVEQAGKLQPFRALSEINKIDIPGIYC